MRINTIVKKPLSSCCLAALLSASAGASQAACTQADLAGTWLVSGLSTVTYDAANHEQASFTTFCKLKVNSAGVFGKTSSTCDSSSGKTSVEGTMKMTAKSCSVRAFPMKVFANGALIFTFSVDFMALDSGKTTFTATGNKNAATTGLAQFIWQGVKQ